jgi:SAM-dependent methyltransferase
MNIAASLYSPGGTRTASPSFSAGVVAVIQLIKRILGLRRLQDELTGVQNQLANLPEYFLASDGLPIPPAELRRLVGSSDNLSDFFPIGTSCAKILVEALRKNGLDMGDLQSVLDFGCGCGRVIRNLPSLKRAKLYATDYNATLIDWCSHNLPFAHFGVNQLEPPLLYGDETFDLIYSFSFFTHLTEQLQFLWMNELSRVLRTGGWLAISTLDENHLKCTLPKSHLKSCPDLEEQVKTGKFVIVHEDTPGTNACRAYYSFSYMKEKLAKGFEVIEHISGTAFGQTFYLLRKPPHAAGPT